MVEDVTRQLFKAHNEQSPKEEVQANVIDLTSEDSSEEGRKGHSVPTKNYDLHQTSHTNGNATGSVSYSDPSQPGKFKYNIQNADPVDNRLNQQALHRHNLKPRFSSQFLTDDGNEKVNDEMNNGACSAVWFGNGRHEGFGGEVAGDNGGDDFKSSRKSSSKKVKSKIKVPKSMRKRPPEQAVQSPGITKTSVAPDAKHYDNPYAQGRGKAPKKNSAESEKSVGTHEDDAENSHQATTSHIDMDIPTTPPVLQNKNGDNISHTHPNSSNTLPKPSKTTASSTIGNQNGSQANTNDSPTYSTAPNPRYPKDLPTTPHTVRSRIGDFCIDSEQFRDYLISENIEIYNSNGALHCCEYLKGTHNHAIFEHECKLCGYDILLGNCIERDPVGKAAFESNEFKHLWTHVICPNKKKKDKGTNKGGPKEGVDSTITPEQRQRMEASKKLAAERRRMRAARGLMDLQHEPKAGLPEDENHNATNTKEDHPVEPVDQQQNAKAKGQGSNNSRAGTTNDDQASFPQHIYINDGSASHGEVSTGLSVPVSMRIWATGYPTSSRISHRTILIP